MRFFVAFFFYAFDNVFSSTSKDCAQISPFEPNIYLYVAGFNPSSEGRGDGFMKRVVVNMSTSRKERFKLYKAKKR